MAFLFYNTVDFERIKCSSKTEMKPARLKFIYLHYEPCKEFWFMRHCKMGRSEQLYHIINLIDQLTIKPQTKMRFIRKEF